MIDLHAFRKLEGNGDMGADPADSFEAPLQPQQLQSDRKSVV